VLRALAGFGVFAMAPDGGVTHTPRSLLLRRDTPGSLHHAARFWAERGAWRAWEELDAAMTGGVPHEAAWGTGRFAWLREHPEAARLFDAMMAHFPDDRHAALAVAYDFSGHDLIADIGGGNGEALRHILARYPAARGLVFDLPDVVRNIPAEMLLDGRIATEGGSFLDHVPAGADLYLTVRVLHNWPDEDCLRILSNCRSAMRPGTRLLIVDQLLEPDPSLGRPAGYLTDMQMLVMFGRARERSATEFADLLGRSGFRLRRVTPTASPVSVVEAEAA
jgi:hypothetical protein